MLPLLAAVDVPVPVPLPLVVALLPAAVVLRLLLAAPLLLLAAVVEPLLVASPVVLLPLPPDGVGAQAARAQVIATARQ